MKLDLRKICQKTDGGSTYNNTGLSQTSTNCAVTPDGFGWCKTDSNVLGWDTPASTWKRDQNIAHGIVFSYASSSTPHPYQ